MISKEAIEYYDKLQADIRKRHADEISKFTYYKIAVCAAAIAFSINIAIKLKLEYYHIPMGLAVICWAISMLLGFKFLESNLHILYLNGTFYDVLAGRHKESGQNREAIEIGATTLESIMESKSDGGAIRSAWQSRTLYLGVLFFIAWAVINMWLNTKVS